MACSLDANVLSLFSIHSLHGSQRSWRSWHIVSEDSQAPKKLRSGQKDAEEWMGYTCLLVSHTITLPP